jgi:uncharacterized protein YjbI with pentapeptide repeats
MDRNAFDGLTKLLATSPTRRKALGALLGAGLAGSLGMAEAARKDRKQRRAGKNKKKATGRVSAQAADCLSPGPSSNMNNCPFQGSDFSGDDLSGSSMVGTRFTNARLVGTNLSSSNMKTATFRGANLTCADLSSSTLRNADFRGFPASGPNVGPPTDLTGADLSSSACAGLQTNTRTILCGTTWCDGSVRNDACPSGPPDGFCCRDAECPPGKVCDGGTCDCPAGQVELGNGSCALECFDSSLLCQAAGGGGCDCFVTADTANVCAAGNIVGQCPSGSSADCLPGSVCNAGRVCLSLCGVGPVPG